MNEIKQTVLAMMAMGAAATVEAGWNTSLAGGWRVTGGVEFGAPVKGRLCAAPGWRGNPAPVRQGATADGAMAAAEAQVPKAGGARVDFANGGFIDPSSDASASGAKNTWNWQLPSKTSLISAGEYLESETAESTRPIAGSDDAWSPAVSIELTRELWRSDEHSFGLDCGFGFAWQRCNDFLRMGGLSASRIDTYRRGGYAVDLGDQLWMHEDDSAVRYPGGYGSGMATQGPIMDLSRISVRQTAAEGWTESFSERSSLRGDYEEFDFRFTLKPWWDVTNWLRVYGVIGAEVARTDFELHYWNSAVGSSASDHRGWTVCGLGGAGLMLHGWHGVLGVDFLTRLWCDDLSFESNGVRGDFDRSSWFFRVYLGVEF